MKPWYRSVPPSLLAFACAVCLAVGCAQFLGIDDLPDGCDTDDECQTPERPDWTCNLTTHACEPPSAGNECEDDGDCQPDAPICGDDNQCRGCQDSTECNSTAPFCSPNGACVTCLDSSQCTEATTPICGDDNACRACQEHDECGSSVCDRVTGACVAEEDVAYVAAGGTGDCSRAAPCGTIADGLAFVRANNEARYVVRLDDGTYTEQVVLSDVNVRIIGDGATIQLDAATPNVPVVSVTVNADVTLEGVTIRGANGGTSARGIRCSGSESSTLHVLRSTVTENAAQGINVLECSLVVARSAITKNEDGGIQIVTGAFDITSSFILDNGDVRASVVAGVRISNARSFLPQRFAFNTVAGNEASIDAEAGGVFCDVSPSSTVVATSNIILEGFGNRPAVGGDCTWIYSNIQDKADIPGDIAADPTNIDADCMLMVRPDGLRAIDAASACANAGEDDTGILVDYDGAPRPATDPDMGADEL